MGEITVVCSADSVTVIEVRRYFYSCRLSKVEPRILSVFAIFCKDGFFCYKAEKGYFETYDMTRLLADIGIS